MPFEQLPGLQDAIGPLGCLGSRVLAVDPSRSCLLRAVCVSVLRVPQGVVFCLSQLALHCLAALLPSLHTSLLIWPPLLPLPRVTVCSPHVWTGLIGLTLLSFQAMLPLFFAESRDSRTVVSAVGAVAEGVVPAAPAARETEDRRQQQTAATRRRGSALQTAADGSKPAELYGSAPRYGLPHGASGCR